MSELPDDQLRSVLRAEASRHQPDREAMLARITSAAMTGPAPARRPSSQLRLAVVAGLVALFGGGGFAAQWALAGDSGKEDATPPVVTTTPATTGPTTLPSATTSPADRTSPAPTVKPSTVKPSTKGATTATTTTPATGAPETPGKGAPGNTRAEQGPLWSDGSIDPGSGDTQGASVITLRTTETLTALKVTVRVAGTAGLTSRGGTKSVPGASVTTGVTDQGGALLYTFTLAPADEVAPGTYTFTAKYTHDAGGRDAGGDTYEAVATTAGGRSLDVYGNFFPAK
ncbi:hypothetical protein Acy02nite_65990 [Actinoplanes cyaneus]|uniref:Uncharacterized protein n=1 Tax=Actinoplanes cyaneus TaxID=52696 RepID=A0A919INR9_9ACTN|nr:hypothetical protein [Actinoplanes cyaneus]MCW2143758.1 protein RodZ, contains Xre-like HTH and DUF4115 domains [Actinoplanes cyaneus]GID68718.1 hypothetical protein Acy02nite_65990 [Actinoplanes cyaneus]